MDLTLGTSVTRPLEVGWDAPPEAVGSALSRAIAEQRFEDAGNDTMVGWRAEGTVEGRAVDIRMTTVGAPGGPWYGYDINVQGELIDDHGGTRLRARASVPRYRWVLPLVAGLWVVLALITAVGLGYERGPVVALIAFALVLAGAWLLMTVINARVNRSLLGATPRVETVLMRLGTPLASG